MSNDVVSKIRDVITRFGEMCGIGISDVAIILNGEGDVMIILKGRVRR